MFVMVTKCVVLSAVDARTVFVMSLSVSFCVDNLLVVYKLMN